MTDGFDAPGPPDQADIPLPHLRPSLGDYEQQARGAGGLVCAKCGCRHFLTPSTWRLKDGTVRRLRVCRHCGQPINTTEHVDTPPEAGDGAG